MARGRRPPGARRDGDSGDATVATTDVRWIDDTTFRLSVEPDGDTIFSIDGDRLHVVGWSPCGLL